MKHVLVIVLKILAGSIAMVLLLQIALVVFDRRGSPVAASLRGEALILEGSAFRSPDPSPEQTVAVTAAHALRIEVHEGHPLPTPAERGARVILQPEYAARLENRPVVIEVSYQSSQAFWSTSVRASHLAVSLQGIGPATWVLQPISEESGVIRVEAPAQIGVSAIGLRAIAPNATDKGAVEVTRLRITPAPSWLPSAGAAPGSRPNHCKRAC